MRYIAQRDFEKECEKIENSDMDEYQKANAITDAQIARDYIFAMEDRKDREKEKEKEEQRAKYYDSYSSGCLLMMGFVTVFAGLTGVGVAKAVSNATDVKPSQSITQPCEKATLISKNKVAYPKSLDNEHLKS